MCENSEYGTGVRIPYGIALRILSWVSGLNMEICYWRSHLADRQKSRYLLGAGAPVSATCAWLGYLLLVTRNLS